MNSCQHPPEELSVVLMAQVYGGFWGLECRCGYIFNAVSKDKGLIESYLQNKLGGVYMEAYCMKCRKKREIVNAEQIVMKNGRAATKGECSVCGTKVFKINKKGE